MIKDITTLDPGEYEVEFAREETRKPGTAVPSDGAGGVAQAVQPSGKLKLSRCILRVVASGEEVEDTSRATAGAAAGTRYIATVSEDVRYAAFRPLIPVESESAASAAS